LTARGLQHFGPPNISILQDARLPRFHRDECEVLAWPPPQPSFALQVVQAMQPPSGPPAREVIDRHRREEARRVNAFYEQREREVEERRQAELREFQDAERAWRRAQGWPT
jgi:hypothetical protein